MDTNLLFNLFLNLAGAGFLFMFAKWFINYDMAWWLRDRRGFRAFKDMRDWNFLKIKLPRDVFKTPAAMEVVLITLNQGLGHKPGPVLKPYKGPFYKWVQSIKQDFFLKYMNGSIRAWSSLEIISDAGEIYFLVVTKANNREIFKQYAYSQFPGIEITEEKEDPLNKFTYTDNKTGNSQIYVGKYAVKKNDHIPIKTYVDYGLDKEMVKDEFKIDPLVVLLEAMSQAKKGEMYWFQILIRPTIYNEDDDKYSEHKHNWKGETQKAIDEIMQAEEKEIPGKDDGHGNKGKPTKVKNYVKSMLNLSLTEKHMVEIMQKNLEKPAFDCVIKMFYWVDKNVNPKGMDLARGIMTIVNAAKTFSKPGYNILDFESITTDGDFPFLDPDGSWTERKRRDAWKKSKLRAAFYQEAPGVEFFWKFFPMMWQRWRVSGNWDAAKGLWGEIKEYWKHPGEYPHRTEDAYENGHGFVLNLEELATLWHFPGKVFGGNAESKVGSVKADPPSNLPI